MKFQIYIESIHLLSIVTANGVSQKNNKIHKPNFLGKIFGKNLRVGFEFFVLLLPKYKN